MNVASVSGLMRGIALGGMVCLSGLMLGQKEVHGRKYQPPPATAHIVISVQKDFNEKPLVNAAVIFHAIKDGHDTGNMEVKTDSRGQAIMDFIEAGSHVTVQVIASGFATHAEEFDVTSDDKNVLVKMRRPQAQVSGYEDNTGKAASDRPGVQEPPHPAKPQAGTATPH